ncbi:MAG: hypothetical protein QM765_30890 [Myxococcales bacterium]
MVRLCRSVLFGSLLLAAACGNPSVSETPIPIGSACTAADTCASKGVCVESVCRAPCKANSECSGATNECSGGGCQPAACGNKVIAPTEDCDGNEGCGTDCKSAPGWTCSSGTCTANVYQVALVDDGAGTITVVDVALSGTPKTVATLAQGFNTDSPWPEFSADGTQLAYPSGPNKPTNGAVYLFDVYSSSTDPYGWFAGDQMSFASEEIKLVARRADGYTIYQNETAGAAVTVSGSKVTWPKFDPSDAVRFAFIDTESGNLKLVTAGSKTGVDLSEGAVSDFAWLPAGKIAYLEASGTACALKTMKVDSTTGERATLVKDAPCTAKLHFSPTSADQFVLIPEGKSASFSLTAPAAGGVAFKDLPTVTLTDAILDGGWTADGLLVGLLSRKAGAEAVLNLVSLADPTKPVATSVKGSYSYVRMSPAIH